MLTVQEICPLPCLVCLASIDRCLRREIKCSTRQNCAGVSDKMRAKAHEAATSKRATEQVKLGRKNVGGAGDPEGECLPRHDLSGRARENSKSDEEEE